MKLSTDTVHLVVFSKEHFVFYLKHVAPKNGQLFTLLTTCLFVKFLRNLIYEEVFEIIFEQVLLA